MKELENVLLIAIGIFVILQFFNGILNLLTARHIRKMKVLEMKAREDEARELFEQWELVAIRLNEIQGDVENLCSDFQYLKRDFSNFEDRLGEPKPKVIRGKYKPRAKKAIEHKKAPLTE